MDLKPLSFASPLLAYEKQAATLLAAHRAADPAAIELFHRRHPRFLDDKIKWLPRTDFDFEIRDAALRSTMPASRSLVATISSTGLLSSPTSKPFHRLGQVAAFETAVEAVVAGDLGTLQDALSRDPALVRARSSRRCCFDPPVHRATLLHYIGANGVEHDRQRTPPNAVAIAHALLEGGAEPDALADMYGAECTTMSMLVSSSHPANAGLQVPLINLLLDFGAAIEGRGTRKRGNSLFTALAFGMSDAAATLAERGARVELPHAAGLGVLYAAARLLPTADHEARHRALSLSCTARICRGCPPAAGGWRGPQSIQPGRQPPAHDTVASGRARGP